jgi:hypothetical protein
MAFDVSKLKTPQEAQNLMDNARRMGREDIYQLAFTRKCELESRVHDDPNDPLVRDFWMMVAAYEQLLSEKNEKRTAAARTRQKVAKDGVFATLQSWARRREPTMGFQMLSEAGQWTLTGEYLVVKYAHRFATEDVEEAKRRLRERGFPDSDRISAADRA